MLPPQTLVLLQGGGLFEINGTCDQDQSEGGRCELQWSGKTFRNIQQMSE